MGGVSRRYPKHTAGDELDFDRCRKPHFLNLKRVEMKLRPASCVRVVEWSTTPRRQRRLTCAGRSPARLFSVLHVPAKAGILFQKILRFPPASVHAD
jgi:hypothetical protein